MTARFGLTAIASIALTLSSFALDVAFAQTPGSSTPPTAQAGGQPARGPQPTPPCGPNLPPSVKNVDKQSRCFELRTYTVRPGSSIDLLHSRFREHSMGLFKKHGMTVVGFWQPVAKPDTLIYILVFKDAATRDALWAEFNADPEWIKTRTEMQVNVQVDAVFMSATDYSPLK
jgi:hypothetical protein